ncbi:MAG TPA: serine hydrolase domain-containing protein [Thermomicrobiales bacterium]
MDEVVRGVAVGGAREAGFDPHALRRAFDLIEQWVARGVVPGAAALVARGGRIVGEAYFGDRATGHPADSETIWGLASVTKPFTATAVMLMVERGLIALDEPLADLLPEFLDAPETPFDRHAVTLRHLLAHCSGLPGISPDNFDLRRAHQPLEAFVASFRRQPLLFAPGTLHYYSNPGILMAAEVVGRAVSGTLRRPVETPAVGQYHAFVHQQILAPLGMAASSLLPSPEWSERIAHVAGTGQEGEDWEMANSAYYRGLGIPWGGLFSRPRDLVRFVDCALPAAGGRQRIGHTDPVLPGTRILFPATTRAMTTIQFAPPDAPADLAPELRDGTPPAIIRPEVAWGIGWEIKGTKRLHPSGDLTSPATFGHLGSTGTMVWADPETDIVCILLTNRTLASGWTTERPRQAHFSNAVMAAAL